MFFKLIIEQAENFVFKFRNCMLLMLNGFWLFYNFVLKHGTQFS